MRLGQRMSALVRLITMVAELFRYNMLQTYLAVYLALILGSMSYDGFCMEPILIAFIVALVLRLPATAESTVLYAWMSSPYKEHGKRPSCSSSLMSGGYHEQRCRALSQNCLAWGRPPGPRKKCSNMSCPCFHSARASVSGKMTCMMLKSHLCSYPCPMHALIPKSPRKLFDRASI